MDSLRNAYCRFCAEPKSSEKLINLQSDGQAHGDVLYKLNFLNANYINVSKKDSLPKTICLVCYDLLNKSYEFLSGVKRAQGILSSIFPATEANRPEISDDENVDDFINNDSISDNPIIKSELENSTNPPDSSKQTKIHVNNDDNMEGYQDLSTTKLRNNRTIKSETKKQSEQNDNFEVKQEPSDAKDDQYPISLYVNEFLDATLGNFTSDMTLYAKDVTEMLKKPIKTWTDYPWVCVYCSIEFINPEMLSTHAKLVHGKCSALYCIDCKIGRKEDFGAFIKHIRKHRRCLRNYCHYCNKYVKDTSKLKSHIKEHYPKPQLPCPLCGEILSNEDALKLHIHQYSAIKTSRRPRRKKGTPITIEDLTCKLCKKVYKNPNSLRDHQKLHTTERKRDYTCDRCGKMFYNKGTLTSHIMSHDKIYPHICRICNKSFLFPNMLRRHVEMHSGIKPFSCEQCGRCFRLQNQLNQHKIIHTDSMPYVCVYCSKAFRFKQILKNHERQHTGAKPYACQNCGMEFTNWSNYNKHMKRRHGTDTSKKKITPEGVFPINPATGQIVQVVDPVETEQWKTAILVPAKRGKKKTIKQENIT